MNNNVETPTSFRDRLAIEEDELDNKIMKLEIFIESDAFATIDPVQGSLLNIQLAAMNTYNKCLGERIDWLDKNKKQL